MDIDWFETSRIAPDNMRLALYYELPSFSAKIEQVIVREQTKLSRSRMFGQGRNFFGRLQCQW